MKYTSYANPQRLADIMCLIQVLALGDVDKDYGEHAPLHALGRQPTSGYDWKEIASAHPEFFLVDKKRVDKADHFTISLIARVIAAKRSDKHEALPSEFVAKMLEIAVNLHDRERARIDKWKPWLISILVAVIIGLSGIATASIKAPTPSPCAQATPTH